MKKKPSLKITSADKDVEQQGRETGNKKWYSYFASFTFL
jgi:hypothetical protein